MVRFTALLLLPLGLASAQPSMLTTRQDSAKYQVVVGAATKINTYEFDGSKFILKKSVDVAASPSWMLPKDGLLYAVNENGNDTNAYKYNADTGVVDSTPAVTGLGSPGVVSLAFTEDLKHLLGAGYTSGTVDIWDISDSSKLTLKKTLKLGGNLGTDPIRQSEHHAHQAIRDLSNRYFAVADLGGDSIHIIDSQDGRYGAVPFEIAEMIYVAPGAGPRHGRFFKDGETTYYAVACELDNMIRLWKVNYKDGAMVFPWEEQDTVSTYGTPPKNATTAAAGEMQVVGTHVYVSNRLSGDEEDHIAHFVLDTSKGNATLVFKDQVASGGISPRMFSKSWDEKFMFSVNMQGTNGVVAFERGEDGSLKLVPGSAIKIDAWGTAENITSGFGPSFILQTA